jgi:ribosome-associated toxin RatA of RatAB toxin-antitoxin module
LHLEQTQVVKAPREHVFQAFADFEAWPKFSTYFKRVTVTERAGNTLHFDTEVKVMGRKTKRTEKWVLTPPEQIQMEGAVMGSTNTTLWKFEPVSEGTRLTAVVDAQLKGWAKLLGPLAKRRVRALLRNEMHAFVNFVEAK